MTIVKELFSKIVLSVVKHGITNDYDFGGNNYCYLF